MHIPEFIQRVLNTMRENQYQIYIVGGPVRDLILKRPITNWDFATNATPDEVLKIYPNGFYNNQFGTVGIAVEDSGIKHTIEITTFRKESNYADSRHPTTINWADTIEEDLARRDFTINAIAYDGKTIIDPYHGQDHIREKIIMAVGEADARFTEDALRLMRAVRFASELGFLIEEKTRHAIMDNAESITKISWERIRDELFKTLASPHPAEGILFLHNLYVLHYILPEVDICFTVPQKSPHRHHKFDVGTHLVESLRACQSPDVITRFATLLHDIGKAQTFRKDEKTELITFYNHEVVGTKQTENIAQRLKLSKKDTHKLVTLVRFHQFTVNELQTDKALRRFVRNVGKEYLEDMFLLRTADRIGSGSTETSWRTELFKTRLAKALEEPFSIPDMAVDGSDIMRILSVPPGPLVGKILKELFDAITDGTLKNDRALLLKSVEEKMNQK